ncbi:uroporphyrinogen-III C-methyltransferase [uncultured Ruthenibacterium sp.]|uniref:uroporphyrinogen-III C-methyltransferase n=1 Tax=uncultured Ruthenibacterium sp. TaxID=1905347 RepID=UPI00349E571C
MEKRGQVYLVGAGCGSADLITLRGLRLLQTCDAVVYDDLIDLSLLEYAPSAELYAAGKRCGKHSMPQPEINALLIRLGNEGKTVVRLKGGDPFVFGRGGEEFLALQEEGIPCEVVPGISSCIAVPQAAGIPVTHRGLSRSFHVITGHTAQKGDALPESIDTLAALQGTLVFLMGLNQLENITSRLIKAGRSVDTPAAVISGGNSPHPATVHGTLENIVERTQQAKMQAPAVIVIGDTAALKFCDVDNRPLKQVRVGLVGTSAFTTRLAEKLSLLGAHPVSLMTGRIEPLMQEIEVDLLTEKACWIVLTSRNGVKCFFDCLQKSKIDLRRLHQCRFAAIGPATEQALWERGIKADLVAHPATGQALASQLAEQASKEEKIFLFRSASSSPQVRDILEQQGFEVSEYRLYRTVFTANQRECEVDYLAFASAEGVRAWFSTCGAPRKETTCVCIGPVTAAALSELSDQPFLMADDISASGVAACILQAHKTCKTGQVLYNE